MENLKRRRVELKRSLKAAAKDAKVLQSRRPAFEGRLHHACCRHVLPFLTLMAVIAADVFFAGSQTTFS